MTEQFNTFDRELGWDDEITKDGGIVLLEPGEYWFTVTKLERTRHTQKPGNKLPSCNAAELSLRIEDREGNEKFLTHRLFLHSMTEGLLSSFFGAIGHKKHGQPLKMNWQAVVGSVGVCTVKKGISSKGNEYNDVGHMIYADDVKPGNQLNDRPGTNITQAPGVPSQGQPYQTQSQFQTPPVIQQQAPQQPSQPSWNGGAF